MKFFFAIGAVVIGFSSLVNAAAIGTEHVQLTPITPGRANIERRQTAPSCTGVANGPNNRNCWTSGFTSSTDMYTSWPNTGVIRSYNLRIENTTCNPDGAGTRVCMLINGRTPGPTIVANWGDTIVSWLVGWYSFYV
ncbi:hypothetical protein T440DRAFT_483603 [Plenodomus tracheiphilus IPT5]|uniref:Plastocyanin-like domain-containing protein n=1 Tax=Plenodomus tracheiphilus IPT5 TaxID=1408161 RepID=A0A6A7AS75_9PLEO|nr:hypothetical protein T440DRAFT_483603 [Plenodomus tracheiphilus IPT5]